MIKRNTLQDLQLLSNLKKERIQSFVSKAKNDILLISDHEALQHIKQNNTVSSSKKGKPNTMSKASDKQGGNALQDLLKYVEARAIMITNAEGDVLYSTDYSLGSNIKIITRSVDDDFLVRSRGGVTFSQVLRSGSDYQISAGAPFGKAQPTSLLCFVVLDLNHVYEDMLDNMHLGESIEVILAENRENIALYLNPTKSNPDAAVSQSTSIGSDNGLAIQQAVLGKEGSGYSVDYRGVETLSKWSTIPELNWGIETKIDLLEIDKLAFVVIHKIALWGSIILLLTLVLSLLFSNYFISPLLLLKESLSSISKGVIPEKNLASGHDEIGQMAAATNELIETLQRTADFAEKIGKGELSAAYEPSGKNDLLGNSLIEMRENLIESEQKDAERNWIINGVAEISEILRSYEDIDELADSVIAFITEKTGAVQGAFYVVNEDDPNDIFIELKSAFAYHKKKYMEGKIKFSEGLVGQAAIEKDYILRTEIPEDYMSITSGILGDQKPSCLLISPLITEEKVYGVVELAGFHRFTESQIAFVQEISLILSRTINNLKVNIRTRLLLEESQNLSNELQKQQEILKQNAEEMSATQEELKLSNHRLEDQIEKVNRTQTRLQLLLENASEVIAIYEEEGNIRYISPSVEKILGYSQKDLIGINDKVFVDPDGITQYDQMFEKVLENPFASVSAQYEYTKKNGETIWLEATATNLLSDPAIQGIILNSRDITEKRRAEREERMKSKMQALSENSPDLITRITKEGEVFYINPMIENYTGHKRTDILNKQLAEIALDDRITEEWAELLQQADDNRMKIKKEIDFPTIAGDRIMQVNAIPEFDDNDALESVLIVSHDITERKKIELEIQSKNNKITESINYAKRIQKSILPYNAVIRQLLPDSFILSKAKDVVSGDFPWFANTGDTIYFAAVDCTGHGVPGALISLIGYFLLNDIVKGKKVSDPGEILDLLDKRVTKTLRQDTDASKAKDGMDIALCKIDLLERKVTYAGAHRPLYYMNQDELVEIKGNKFPIGGGIYKNQTKFSSTTIEISKGDSIFFCSDGFADQFGGPDNRKYGSKRLREAIVKYHKKSMPEICVKLEEEWEEWKGNEKQTDDVLFIGVRL
jgi:PAS domain S-box-containing protein